MEMGRKNEDTYTMAKDEFGNNLLDVLAIIGGAWLTAELLKLVSKRKTVYDCPVCSYDVEFGTEVCPNCKSHLVWPNDPEHSDYPKDAEVRDQVRN